jgi:(p)ppGpp synthase/HD superfamily hydrolase
VSPIEFAARVEKRSPLIKEAFECAATAHKGKTRRAGASPFITHPVAVAGVIEESGMGEDVIAAALLHDVIEATPLDLEDVERRCGGRVAKLVAILTENESILSYEERKREHRNRVAEAPAEAAAIYAADKLCNVRELRRLYEREGEEVAHRYPASLDVRIALWQEDLKMLSSHRQEVPLVSDLELELHELQAQRSQNKAA